MGSRKPLFSVGHSKDQPEYSIALLGALGVGKSAMTVKYLTKRFIMEYDPTLEDVYCKTDVVDGQELLVKVMDTCDAEDAKPERYLAWAHGFIVVYSMTSRGSFDVARQHLEMLVTYQRQAERDITIALIGNKVDLERYRVVSKAAGESLAIEYDTSFYETSAADDFSSIERVFHDVLRDVSRLNDGPLPLQPLYISEDQQGVSLRTNPRRTKSPRPQEIKDKEGKERKEDKDPRNMPRRTVSTFKIFNKGFKIFN